VAGTPQAPVFVPPGVRQLSLLFVVMMFASLVVASVRLPFGLAAGVFSLLAAVVGARLWWLARALPGLGALRIAVLFGMVFALLGLLSSASGLLLLRESVARQECLERALTVQAEQACEVEFTESIESRFGINLP